MAATAVQRPAEPFAPALGAMPGDMPHPLWDSMAEDLVSLIACYLKPPQGAAVPADSLNGSCDLQSLRTHYLEGAVGAAHWMQLNRVLLEQAGRPWRATLEHNRKCHHQTDECCRVLEIRDDTDEYDWPLAVLRLRASKLNPESNASKLSHATPIAKNTLRAAYWQVAMEVHPDRSAEVGSLATKAMVVLNEAYRLSLLHFAERGMPDVIRLDALGLEHHA